jgi:hypothetical protein
MEAEALLLEAHPPQHHMYGNFYQYKISASANPIRQYLPSIPVKHSTLRLEQVISMLAKLLQMLSPLCPSLFLDCRLQGKALPDLK